MSAVSLLALPSTTSRTVPSATTRGGMYCCFVTCWLLIFIRERCQRVATIEGPECRSHGISRFGDPILTSCGVPLDNEKDGYAPTPSLPAAGWPATGIYQPVTESASNITEGVRESECIDTEHPLYPRCTMPPGLLADAGMSCSRAKSGWTERRHGTAQLRDGTYTGPRHQ